jgi:hypothetical protein
MQIIETVNASRMAVAPNRLDAIPPHALDFAHFERPWRELPLGTAMDVPHDIRLPFAAGAGASAPKRFQRDVTFRPILPSDGEFVSDRLNVSRLHLFRHNVNPKAGK